MDKQKFLKTIGMTRQWLNEYRITDPKKMVKNEELIYWFEFNNLFKRK